MPRVVKRLKMIAMLPVAALIAASCASTVPDGNAGAAASAREAGRPGAPPEGVVRSGATTFEMSRQYTPRSGAVAAAGASAWVAPAPAPAFVATGPMPPASAPAPSPIPPPPARAAAPAAVTPQPPAAQARPAAPAQPPAPPAVDMAGGRALFNDWSCGTCHVLADAGTAGAIGPALDGNEALTAASIAAIVTHGQGAMPGFGGQLSDEEIATLSAYIVAARR